MADPTLPSPGRSKRRRFVFFGAALLLNLLMTAWLADLFWASGLHRAHILLLTLFFVLNAMLVVGAFHALLGGIIRLRGRWAGVRITGLADSAPACLLNRYAIVIPVYGEDPVRVGARMESIYRSLERTGQLESFDFFILSDTRHVDGWIDEEIAWTNLCRKLGGFGRIYYRRRESNDNRKAGNISDFIRQWGGGYEAMLVLDADSLMEGRDIVTMARTMEARPKLGILQTAPKLIHGTSVFTRLQQFAMRLYGPLFIRGLNYWQLGGGSYWGHNALIRIRPFSELCELPGLPGREPFGGRILSHDFVEAALMSSEGWEVWLAWDLQGSYEEAPPTLVDHLKRDRRWCQGNLQHIWLLAARRIPASSRVHLLMGIMAYLGSPLWFLFLVLGTWIAWDRTTSELSSIPFNGYVQRHLNIGLTTQGLILGGLVLALIFLPKICAWIGGLCVARVRRSFGGFWKMSAGVLLEIAFSVLLAPIVMISHTQIVLSILSGRAVGWTTQSRETDGSSWTDAIKVHGPATAAGVAWTALAAYISPSFLAWMSPILAGLVLSIPLSVLTSRARLGHRLRTAGLLNTPEEIEPPPVLAHFAEAHAAVDPALTADDRARRGWMAAVVDPYVNAVHVTLLDGRPPRAPLETIERCLAGGADGLTPEQQVALAYDPAAMLSLHREVWLRAVDSIHPSWRQALSSYRPDLAS